MRRCEIDGNKKNNHHALITNCEESFERVERKVMLRETKVVERE